MNYIDFLKNNGKVLVISGAPGSGKTLLSRQLADSIPGNCVTVSSGELLHNNFDDCSVAIIEVDDDMAVLRYTFSKIKEIASSSTMQINLKGKSPYTIKTPFFILNTTCSKEVLLKTLTRRFAVIELSRSL